MSVAMKKIFKTVYEKTLGNPRSFDPLQILLDCALLSQFASSSYPVPRCIRSLF